MKATIVHANGSGTVQNFEKIEEADDQQTIRVYYDEPGPNRLAVPDEGLFYEEYHYGRIVEVVPDDDEEGGDLIEVDY